MAVVSRSNLILTNQHLLQRRTIMEQNATPVAASAKLNLAKDLNLKTELQKKKPTHKLLFDNGEEIDLTQAGLISSAKPIVGQLKTPSL